MFTETLTHKLRDRVLRSPLLDLLTGPHGVDRYTEIVDPVWIKGNARAKVVAVRRQTSRSVTLTLEPNRAFTGFMAGQHINLSVEINGRRRTRPYSPASAEGGRLLELTVGLHDGGLVSTHLYENAKPGMTVGLDSVGGDFFMPAQRPRRILFVSGGSGITPVLSMLRTLKAEGFTGDAAFIHYARSAEEACYRDELDTMPGVRVLHGYTRDDAGADLDGYFAPHHLAAAMAEPDAIFVCGPPALVDAVRELRPDARSESFVPPVFTVPAEATGGTVTFAGSAVQVADSGQTLLQQAEAAGLNPESGCRMGICFSCTRTKTRGAVRNVLNGTVSTDDCEDIRICVTAPVGDVEIDL
ncbi:ferredoxin reductase [Mycolicibacterium fluoranthenivorans]|jgi:ferredoxin-NADP reductase|uniref:Ferredoxin reductase n=1 Tax=Mycolicibacterium fluoranthenivorans TaxID=258505 RepID=A0A7G8PKU2_9MYCO|nr:ferredoxin reductase [Mycolicibacterium fluoranthenivorans]QNJ94958.1 ferredoxin reductase [Mycolicibacterium fluoranthenivorans]